jgi:hypothetical protein
VGIAATAAGRGDLADRVHWIPILTHLEAIGEIRRIAGEPERWAA